LLVELEESSTPSTVGIEEDVHDYLPLKKSFSAAAAKAKF